MNTIEGSLVADSGANTKFAILVARFNGFIVESLLEGAIDKIGRAHV